MPDGSELPDLGARRRRKKLREFLSWQLAYAKSSVTLSAAYRERGLPVPDHFYAPFLEEYLHSYMHAFWELCTCRVIGMSGAGPIPWDSLDRWAERHGYDEDQVLYDDFVFLMRQLDMVFLEDQEDRRKREQSKNGDTKGFRSPDGGSGGGRYIQRG